MNIDVVDNLFDVLNVSHQFPKDLLEIKAWDATAKGQPTFRDAPTDVLENRPTRAFKSDQHPCGEIRPGSVKRTQRDTNFRESCSRVNYVECPRIR